MFQIGEFSRMTGLTVKALRFYHEQGLLVPARIDVGSGYRLYDTPQIEVARVIAALRTLDFPITEIKTILRDHRDDADILGHLESRRDDIESRLRRDRRTMQQLNDIILHVHEANRRMNQASFEVEPKAIEPILVASVRMKGKYSDCGIGFGKIGRKFGRHVCGKPMLLHHDAEYREDAHFEAAMPIKKGESTDEITVQELPGGRCISLMHLGPYEELGRSYEKLLQHAQSNHVAYSLPTREVYHKGPGMIFRGNPAKYLTELQLMIDAPDGS